MVKMDSKGEKFRKTEVNVVSRGGLCLTKNPSVWVCFGQSNNYTENVLKRKVNTLGVQQQSSRGPTILWRCASRSIFRCGVRF